MLMSSKYSGEFVYVRLSMINITLGIFSPSSWYVWKTNESFLYSIDGESILKCYSPPKMFSGSNAITLEWVY